MPAALHPLPRSASALALVVLTLALAGGIGTAAPLFPVLFFDSGGYSPRAVRIADLDGDSKLDLVTADAGPSTISVLLGNGDGTFAPANTFPTGSEPYSVTLADVDGNGILDAVTANHAAGTVSILLGDGAGGFGPKTDVVVGAQPRAAQVADVNGDGRKDILTANYAVNTFSVLIRKSNGTYAAKVDYPCTVNPTNLAVGDVNHDGKLDVAVCGDNTTDCGVALGNGNGTFQYPIIVGTGGPQSDVALADLDGDSNLDLITANPHSLQKAAVVRLGNGDGTFAPPASYATGSSPRSLVVQDVTGDGTLDLVTPCQDDHTVSVLSGYGDGTFAAHGDWPTGTGPVMVQAADANADGRADLITVHPGDSKIFVLIGHGGGRFGMSGAPARWLKSMTIASVDGDPFPDLVTLEQGCSNTCWFRDIDIYRGNGDAIFTLASRTGVEYPQDYYPYIRAAGLAVGDFNGDGMLDVVTGNSGYDLVTMSGGGDGTLGAQVHTAVSQITAPIVAGDYNQDGKLDAIVDTRMWIGAGDGTFSAGPMLASAGWAAPVRLNHDFAVDLARVVPGSDLVEVALGNGDGTFQDAVSYATGSGPSELAVEDLNRDRSLDLVTANEGSATVSVLLGNGDGTFAPHVEFPTSNSPRNVTIADANGDGHADIVTFGNLISVLPGQGDGTFGPRTDYGPYYANAFKLVMLGARDLDGDQRTDLVMGLPLGSILVLRNIGTGPIVSVEHRTAPPVMLTIAPNPVRDGVRFAFHCASDAMASLEILDVAGRRVKTVFIGPVAAGAHEFSWNGEVSSRRMVRPGVYLARLTLDRAVQTRRVVWLGP